MDHFGGTTLNDFLSPPQQQQHMNPNSWSNPDFASYMHQQQQQQQGNNDGGPFNANSLGAIYVSNIPLMPPTQGQHHHHQQQQQQQVPVQQYDENGQPIKIRKKPGRKPNPASPALRKAQNRAAQRAFRERKERHLKDLEGTIRQLREQRNSAVKELNQTKSKMDSFRAENWYLKGVVLTLQFVCLHHNIHIPTHSPYLTEEALSEMAKTTPHGIEAYVNAYTRNNINLKPTMAAHFANGPNEKDSPLQSHKEHDENEDAENNNAENEDSSNNDREATLDTDMMDDEDDEDGEGYSRGRRNTSEKLNSSLSPESSYVKIEEEEEDETMTQWVKQHNENKKKREQEEKEKAAAAAAAAADGSKEGEEKPENASSISAIQRIRLQLRVQSTITNVGKSAVRLQPTILQLAIPHDPRIDLIPTPHMRDRMIIFRDQMDYDRCFAMLLNGAYYHGGDPTMSASWELPAEFFTEFWYLAINYDVNRTNTWRRLKGLPEIRGGADTANIEQPMFSLQQQHQESVNNNSNAFTTSPPSSSSDTVWTDDVFAQMTAGMPTLQPLDANHLSSGFDFGSPTAVMLDDPNFNYHHHAADLTSANPFFEQLMGSPPESRHNRSPSIGAMMDLMNSLSTDMQQQQQN